MNKVEHIEIVTDITCQIKNRKRLFTKMRKAVKAVTIEQALFRFLAWLQTIHWVNHQQRLLLGYKSKGNN